MQCFIHPEKEASSICTKCGKAMCVNCSAYSNHCGICPECRRDEFIMEKLNLENTLSSLQKKKSKFIVFAVLIGLASAGLSFVDLFAALFLIFTVIFGLKAYFINLKCKPMAERIDYLSQEIEKLNLALQKGNAVI